MKAIIHVYPEKKEMILVTGGTGFLGSVLIGQLLAKSYTVRAIKRASGKIPKSLQNQANLTWVDADILDLEDLVDAFEGITQVYHCAALVSFNPKDKEKILFQNIQGTAHIVNLCLNFQVPLMHVSSIAALGESKKGEHITEKHLLAYDPKLHDYGLSKYESEMEVWRGEAEGLKAIIVNPSVIIGKAAGVKGTGALFKLIKDGLNYYTNGSTAIVDVHDVAYCMIELMEKQAYGERFIISAANITYQQLFNEIAKAFNIPGPQKQAKPWMLSIAWRWSKLKSLLEGKAPGLTKHTARSSFNQNNYSNQKLLNTIDFSFRPIQQSIAEASLGIIESAPETI